jgi:hypothetical protein
MTQFTRRVRIIRNIYGTKKAMKKLSLVILASMLIPFIGFAHEGHGAADGFTITHYFVEPPHAIYTWSFLLVSCMLVSYYKLNRKRSSK